MQFFNHEITFFQVGTIGAAGVPVLAVAAEDARRVGGRANSSCTSHRRRRRRRRPRSVRAITRKRETAIRLRVRVSLL
jgi:hypothetical protein